MIMGERVHPPKRTNMVHPKKKGGLAGKGDSELGFPIHFQVPAGTLTDILIILTYSVGTPSSDGLADYNIIVKTAKAIDYINILSHKQNTWGKCSSCLRQSILCWWGKDSGKKSPRK